MAHAHRGLPGGFYLLSKSACMKTLWRWVIIPCPPGGMFVIFPRMALSLGYNERSQESQTSSDDTEIRALGARQAAGW